MMTVYHNRDRGFFVVDGLDVLAGPFETNAQAWRWIDRSEGVPISRSEAVSEWLFNKQD